MIYLSETFLSIQGEGARIGHPSLFIRFGGCNLRCEGFGCTDNKLVGCDSIYSVNQAYKASWEQITSLDTLQTKVNDAISPLTYQPDIVITGGEPLIYANNTLFVEFMQWLFEQNFHVTIETNATIAPNFIKYPWFKTFHYALAVKLSNSGEKLDDRVKPDVIKTITQEATGHFFKFTINQHLIKTTGYDEIKQIVHYATIKPTIYCMPLASTRQELEALQFQIIAFVQQYGFIYSDRLHIRLWDDQAGV
jgi:organic radical activating enzyme